MRRLFEMELAPHQVIEDRGAVPKLVYVVERDWGNLRHPPLLVQLVERLLAEEQVELDVGVLVALPERERTVLQPRHYALITLADLTDLLNHGFLLEHLASEFACPLVVWIEGLKRPWHLQRRMRSANVSQSKGRFGRRLLFSFEPAPTHLARECLFRCWIENQPFPVEHDRP